MPNYNPETGIRYGTIYLNHLDADVAYDLWMNGRNVSEENAYDELKSEIERDADAIEEEVTIAIAESDHALLSSERFVENEIEAAYLRLGYDDRDDYIDTRLELGSEDIQIEEPIISGTSEGVEYSISWLGGTHHQRNQRGRRIFDLLAWRSPLALGVQVSDHFHGETLFALRPECGRLG